MYRMTNTTITITNTIIHRHSEQCTHCQPDACFSSDGLFWQTATVSLTFVCIQSTVDINWIWMIYGMPSIPTADRHTVVVVVVYVRYIDHRQTCTVQCVYVCLFAKLAVISFHSFNDRNTCSYFIRSSITITQNYLESNIFTLQQKQIIFHRTV